MAHFPVAWGLDIGETSVKAVKLARQGNGAKVVAYAVEPIHHGEGVDRDAAVTASLRTLVARADLAKDPVYAALSGRQVFSKTINLPIIDKKTVHRMVELEARQQIPGDFNELLWGYHLSPSAQDDGSYDVALFAAKKDIVNELLARCKAAGLAVAGLSIAGLAVYNFISYDQDFASDESVIVLDVGAQNTDLVVYQGDALWMRNLRISGNDITQAFMKKFRVSYNEAERLKHEVNASNQADRILKVIEGTLGDLVADLKRSLGFYKGQNPKASFQNIVVCGNTFRLELLPEYLANQLGFPIIALVELERISMDDSLDRETFLGELQGMGTAMGLALQAVGMAKADVNLLPSEVLLQQVLARKRWAGVTAVALLALGLGVSYTVKSGRLSDYVQQIQEIQAQSEEEQGRQKGALELVQSLQPLSAALVQFDRIGRSRGAVAQVQGRLLALVGSLSQDPVLRLPEPTRTVEDGGDPVRQPVYLHGIDIAAPDLKTSDLFAPWAADRNVVLSLSIPVGSTFQKVNAQVIQALRSMTLGPGLAAVWGGRSEDPLFASVVEGPTSELGETWQYVDGFRVNARGEADPLNQTRSTRTTLAQYLCTLRAPTPARVNAEGATGE